ncbi:Protease, partial [Thalictrum thalictroides]
TDDSAFSGIDLATLIRNKYGRSYDVQLIKKEFMGRNLLAMNVMWKYMEQRSFPLTEEEYILRLDDVANLLKCWGAVSHIRSSLAKLKERPRIGKAVSIFIDMDESGGRAKEWIYK